MIEVALGPLSHPHFFASSLIFPRSASAFFLDSNTREFSKDFVTKRLLWRKGIYILNFFNVSNGTVNVAFGI